MRESPNCDYNGWSQNVHNVNYVHIAHVYDLISQDMWQTGRWNLKIMLPVKPNKSIKYTHFNVHSLLKGIPPNRSQFISNTVSLLGSSICLPKQTKL